MPSDSVGNAAENEKDRGEHPGLFAFFPVPELGRSNWRLPALLAVFLWFEVILESLSRVTKYLGLLQCNMRKEITGFPPLACCLLWC